jgi:hypothetical protein
MVYFRWSLLLGTGVGWKIASAYNAKEAKQGTAASQIAASVTDMPACRSSYLTEIRNLYWSTKDSHQFRRHIRPFVPTAIAAP